MLVISDSSSRAAVVSSAVPHKYFNRISSPFSSTSSLSINEKKIKTRIGWSNRKDDHNNNNNNKMKTKDVFVTSAAAQPLQDADALIDSVETFIFDCDGVIWKGDKLIEGVPQTLELLRSKGKRLVFVTNNSTKSRKQYSKKFETLGLSEGFRKKIFASSFAAYLQSIDFPKDKKAMAADSDFYQKGMHEMDEELKVCLMPFILTGHMKLYEDKGVKTNELES
ncbi:hypothetical protein M8C21_003539 [Ambrosia artemisiifolia]|uniref:Phosphoglycolate phosphatase n=1 Tax=Ambrosia artemisiifolia TaxID=4212 RepID=A0AAD5GD24_AMBAR|nr:hypothetical protein M8C21_003539 [Ambrosia artemisiifolia]